jgi:hypothetical protein
LDELPFQKGIPLASSDDEEGRAASTKHFALDREVFMMHGDKDNEGLEYVRLDDYDDDYDSLNHSADVTISLDVTNTIKIEDEEDIQKERRKLRNTKRANRRHRVVEQHQRGQGNLYDCSTSDLHTIINVGRDTRNVIIARQQEREEVEAYNPTNYHISLDYPDITRERKPEAGEQSTQRKRTLNLKKRFEEALHKQYPWHLKGRHSTFECQTLRRALGAPPLNEDCEERRRDYPNNDLLINYYPTQGGFLRVFWVLSLTIVFGIIS